MNTKLNVKQFAIAWLAVFVVMTIGAYIPIKLELAPWFLPGTQTPGGDEMTRRILIYFGRLVASGLFTYIFTKTIEGTPSVGHGLRYGLGISLLMYVPGLFSAMALSDWPVSALVTRAVVGIVEMVICGAAIAYLYKPAKPATA